MVLSSYFIQNKRKNICFVQLKQLLLEKLHPRHLGNKGIKLSIFLVIFSFFNLLAQRWKSTDPCYFLFSYAFYVFHSTVDLFADDLKLLYNENLGYCYRVQIDIDSIYQRNYENNIIFSVKKCNFIILKKRQRSKFIWTIQSCHMKNPSKMCKLICLGASTQK